MRLLEKIWDTLQDKGIGKDFLVRALVAQGIRPVIDKWDPMKVLALTASVVYTRVVAHACHPSTRKVEVGGSGVQDCFAFPWLGFPLPTKPAGLLCCCHWYFFTEGRTSGLGMSDPPGNLRTPSTSLVGLIV